MWIIDGIKRRLHRDIVADPVLHARVLNLYLCGEAYPHQVDDYFPHRHVDCPDLSTRMQQHLEDEDKHVALYSRAISKLGESVQSLAPEHVFNHVIRGQSTEPWSVDETMDADTRTFRVASFLAHAHVLERRVARSLDFHLDACTHAASPYPAKAVAAVLADEHRHVQYTRDAVFDLLPKQRAGDLLRSHERAESRANLEFSSRQLKRLLVEEAPHWPDGNRSFYRLCAGLMQGVLAIA